MLTAAEKEKLKDLLLILRQIRINTGEIYGRTEDEEVLWVSQLALKIDLGLSGMIHDPRHLNKDADL